jgi:hypothetical protein
VTLANRCRPWKITINAEKSKVPFIIKKRTTPLPPLTFENKVIPWCLQAKYLGVIIDMAVARKLYSGEGQGGGSNSLPFTLSS